MWDERNSSRVAYDSVTGTTVIVAIIYVGDEYYVTLFDSTGYTGIRSFGERMQISIYNSGSN